MRIIRGGQYLTGLTVAGPSYFADGSAAAPSISFSNATTKGLYNAGSGVIGVSPAGTTRILVGTNIALGSGGYIAWNSNADPTLGSDDTIMVRDGANAIAFKNGASAQQFNLYQSYTDASNYRRISMYGNYSGGNPGIQAEGGGTGANPSFLIGATGTGVIDFCPAGTNTYRIQSTAILPQSDNLKDLGNGIARWANGYFGTRLAVGLATNATGLLYLGSTTTLSPTFDSIGGSGTQFTFRQANGSQASRTDSTNGQTILSILGQAYSSGYLSTAAMVFVVDGTFTTGQRPPSRIEFYTNAANGTQTLAMSLLSSQHVRFDKALVALGGGAAPTLGTIGGSGPATAAQNAWLEAKDSTGATIWIPVWK